MADAVDVIIPTTASSSRAMTLRRAIGTVRASTSRRVRIIAVMNGPGIERAVADWLRQQPDVLCLQNETPSLPLALLMGRQHVTAPYFCTLDDDDEYLPGALDLRLSAMEAAMSGSPDASVVVTNGYRSAGGKDENFYDHLDRVATDPLRALFESNWLNSGNALYRTAAVTVDDFADYNAYAEWTWLAYRLALRGAAIVTVNEPTFRIHDTPGSLSKSAAYANAYLSLYERMLTLRPPRAIRRLVLRRVSASWHDFSVSALHGRAVLDAWKCHLRSLRLPGGMRYLSYTRRLIPGWPGAQP